MKLFADVKVMGNTALIQTDRDIDLEDGQYSIEIKQKKSNRTLQQNKYLWALISEICKLEDGDLRDEMNLYCNLLEMAGAKYETIIIQHDALERFRRSWRDVKVVSGRTVNHTVYDTVHAFYGSSQMDTKEMATLIDTAINYASEIGIETDYWRNLLND